jgi:tight junction protein 1
MQPPPKQHHRYDMVSVTPEPPELPAKAKKNPLKSPLKAIKSAIVKGTKTLRRQASFMESGESKKSRSLRRQHSLMERGSNRTFYPPPHHQQDYYEYQQQQYYNYYYQQQSHQQQQQHQQQQRYYPQDERYAWYQRHERYYPANMQYDEEQPVYGNYGPPPEENIYANRALIELERSAPIQTSGGRIVRRHSMNDRQREVPAFATLTKRRSKYVEDIDERFANMSIEEPIYQSQRGSLMYQEQMKPRPMPRQSHFVERPIEDNQKLLQSRKDINSPGTSTTSTPTSLSSPSRERNLRDSRRQLKDQIYQSRLDAMQSMAEPNYLTRSSSGASSTAGNLRSQPIYESKKEAEESHENENSKTMNSSDTSNEHNEGEKSLLEAIEETLIRNKSQDHLNEDKSIPFADDEETEAPATMKSSDTMEESEDSLQRTAIENCAAMKKEPININNIIKRAAPPPPPIRSPTTTKTAMAADCAPTESVYESHTSIDTQASLPTSIGPPDAQSTPYASELTLKEQKLRAKARFLAAPPLRSPITTKGYFDELGGILEDKTWNVSLIIPPGALPSGQKQEIYFTVTDPRMSESVGGPPLDMENGWF